jgi:hypothetical protein
MHTNPKWRIQKPHEISEFGNCDFILSFSAWKLWCPLKYRLSGVYKSTMLTDLSSSGLQYRVTVWLLPDVWRYRDGLTVMTLPWRPYRDGLIFKSVNVHYLWTFGYLEVEATTLCGSARRHAVTRHQITEEGRSHVSALKTKQFAK